MRVRDNFALRPRDAARRPQGNGRADRRGARHRAACRAGGPLSARTERQAEAMVISDRIVVMFDGRIRQIGDAAVRQPGYRHGADGGAPVTNKLLDLTTIRRCGRLSPPRQGQGRRRQVRKCPPAGTCSSAPCCAATSRGAATLEKSSKIGGNRSPVRTKVGKITRSAKITSPDQQHRQQGPDARRRQQQRPA